MARRTCFCYSKQLMLLLFAFLPFSFCFSQNPIVTENALAGNPSAQWDINPAASTTIEGFATDISVNRGETVRFKIKATVGAQYRIDIYRLGYYQGNGARLITSLSPFTGVAQPAPLTNSTTGLIDCGNWSESASWAVPATAVSGVYIAKLTQTNNSNTNHIVFIVRNDASTSDLFFQTSDATWQAYNLYGGSDLYDGNTSLPAGHASKVSYNRPFVTRSGGGSAGPQDWLFNAEYPMIRFLERNGYNVTYTTNVDAARRGNLILNHKVFLSVGHDEYWSKEQRDNVEAARNAGVHLAFFSGNEIYWKTRWEDNYRTLVCYKEGDLGENVCGNKCDNSSPVWTGLWRTGAEYDAGKPENALSGQISWDGTVGSIQVPATYKNLRFWRNTSIASLGTGQTATFPFGTLGYEWNWEQYTSTYPSGRITMSNTTLNGRTHKLSLYRHTSGALVFGAGTVQWAWGLDANHDGGNAAPSTAMQQATINLFADMQVQPATLQPGLVAASASTDFTPPVSVITSPANGASFPANTTINVSGSASDAGGVVAGVEISVDGGTTWQPVTGTNNWTFSWTPTVTGPVNIRVRGFDDSGNMETPGGSGSSNNITVTISGSSSITIFQPTDAPATQRSNDGSPIELGMKFQSTQNGFITGIRYYKGVGTTGTHRGSLWTSTGTLLASAIFINETSSGWQQVLFSSPVFINANTTYVASYFSSSGDYPDTNPYFTQAVINGPLRALANGADGPNGVYKYSATSVFPTDSYNASNYWVDVVFNASSSGDVTPPTVISVSPSNGATGVSSGTSVTAEFNEAVNASTVTTTSFELRNAANNVVTATVSTSSSQIILTPSSALAGSTTYTATIKGGASGVKDLAGNALANDFSWTFTTATTGGGSSITIFQPTDAPATQRSNDGSPIELGMKFQSTQNGFITGIRYYKGVGTTGTHRGSLWTSTGTLLASAIFINETSSGWQQVLFSSPVFINANTTYVASYFSSSGDYPDTNPYFTQAVINGPLRALANGADGPNGVYKYSATSVFPTDSYNASNYWVDVVFNASSSGDVTPPTVVSVSPSNGATEVSSGTSVIANFNEAVNASTVTTTSFELRNAANNVVTATVSTSSSQIILTPSSALAGSTTYTATIKGGASGVKDLAGNALANDFSWTFAVRAVAPPPQLDGAGGPILIVSSVANPFSRYPVEILRAEGLNGFLAKDISSVTATDLNNYDVVILGEMSVTSAQATMFSDWVNAGGTFIAFRPSTQLSTLLGITRISGSLADRYLLVNTASGPGAGIVGQTMQFHGTADLYTLNGASSLATLYTDAFTASGNPAVTTRNVGSNGGKAIAFTYDLAKSIVFTRQGNPAQASSETDGFSPIRPDDLFFPNYLDLNKVEIPQADEQQRLLANIIIQSNLAKKPLPRFWYMPKGYKAAIVYALDDHATPSATKDIFNKMLANSPGGCSVDDWDCYRATSWILYGILSVEYRSFCL